MTPTPSLLPPATTPVTVQLAAGVVAQEYRPDSVSEWTLHAVAALEHAAGRPVSLNAEALARSLNNTGQVPNARGRQVRHAITELVRSGQLVQSGHGKQRRLSTPSPTDQVSIAGITANPRPVPPQTPDTPQPPVPPVPPVPQTPDTPQPPVPPASPKAPEPCINCLDASAAGRTPERDVCTYWRYGVGNGVRFFCPEIPGARFHPAGFPTPCRVHKARLILSQRPSAIRAGSIYYCPGSDDHGRCSYIWSPLVGTLRGPHHPGGEMHYSQYQHAVSSANAATTPAAGRPALG